MNLNKVFHKAKRTGRYLLFMIRYWQLVSKPADTARVFKLNDLMMAELRDARPEKMQEYLYKHPAYGPMLKEKYLPPKYSVEDLKDYTPGTLGHAFYRHMKSNNFKMNFYPPVKVVDDLSYLDLRISQTHDIWHVVTGYGTDVVGEIALQAFYLGQGGDDDSLALTLLSAGLIYAALYQPKITPRLMEGLIEGYRCGKAAGSLYQVRWEELWNRPLDEIRAELKLSEPARKTIAA